MLTYLTVHADSQRLRRIVAGRYNLDHTDDIVCLAMHPGGEIIATGELGAIPKIVVWNSTDKVGFMDALYVSSCPYYFDYVSCYPLQCCTVDGLLWIMQSGLIA